jgi:biopolymer transport protein ExbD
MKTRRKEQPDVGVDMTPMIDMVFLLLVFFMCAATMSKVDFIPEIRLPVAPKSEVPEDLRNRGTINILPEGFVIDTGEAVSDERPFLVYGDLVGEEGLKKRVEARRGETGDFRVYMRVDRDVEFERVRRAIAACAEVGVFDIVFATYQSKGGG